MDSETSPDRTRRARLWLLVAIAVILGGWALQAAGAFTVPVVFSVFLALLVAPLDRKVTEGVPEKLRWLGHVAAMGAILAALLIFVGLIWVAAQQVVERFPFSGDSGSLLPQFGDEVRGNGPGGSSANAAAGSGATTLSGSAGADAVSAAPDGQDSGLGGVLGRLSRVFSGAGGSLAGTLGNWASGMATEILRAAGTTLFATVLVFFLTLIMLIEGPKWRQKVVNVLDPSARR